MLRSGRVFVLDECGEICWGVGGGEERSGGR